MTVDTSTAEPVNAPSEALIYAERVTTRGGDLEAPLGLCYLALELPVDVAIELRGLAAGELAGLVRDLRQDLELAVGLSAELRRRRIRERNRAA
jgi:hypothetical protein